MSSTDEIKPVLKGYIPRKPNHASSNSSSTSNVSPNPTPLSPGASQKSKNRTSKTSSLFSLFTLKEPSTKALSTFEQEIRAQPNAGLSVSTQKLPAHVPPTNSKWKPPKSTQRRRDSMPGSITSTRSSSDAGSISGPITSPLRRLRDSPASKSNTTVNSFSSEDNSQWTRPSTTSTKTSSGLHSSRHSVPSAYQTMDPGRTRLLTNTIPDIGHYVAPDPTPALPLPVAPVSSRSSKGRLRSPPLSPNERNLEFADYGGLLSDAREITPNLPPSPPKQVAELSRPPSWGNQRKQDLDTFPAGEARPAFDSQSSGSTVETVEKSVEKSAKKPKVKTVPDGWSPGGTQKFYTLSKATRPVTPSQYASIPPYDRPRESSDDQATPVKPSSKDKSVTPREQYKQRLGDGEITPLRSSYKNKLVAPWEVEHLVDRYTWGSKSVTPWEYEQQVDDNGITPVKSPGSPMVHGRRSPIAEEEVDPKDSGAVPNPVMSPSRNEKSFLFRRRSRDLLKK